MSKTTKTPTASEAATPRQSKKDQVIALLQREGGASLEDMIAATGWLPHTTRAMLTGLRKKGYALDKQKVDGITRYTITSEPAA